MNILLLLSLLFCIPLLFFVVYLAISCCLGDDFRGRLSGVSFDPRNAIYGKTYARSMASGSSGQAGWEQIEMQDILDAPYPLDSDDEEEGEEFRSRMHIA